ncbi:MULTISPECIES: DUF4397 domain-containing protein [Bacillaceae]|uniref:DUF4397 domain-containing protein n=1 Tax=Bacillaceae TaxID=186817 RepID=UPI000BA6EE6D|nr:MULTISPECIES: DUF4397 domain-containing protein [Bacillaceae]PAE24559.1 hypothetical protein CHI10_12295 [Bacillus sp. 7894-2]URM34408.1 DUF4397 domain-containing protein [Cytobacillus firmus]
MPTERNQQWYLQKAVKYDLLAQYFKYIDAAQHITYYHKHLHCLNQAFQIMRTKNKAPSADTHQGQQTKVRIFHGSPDSGPIDIYINGTRILKDFSYKDVSSYATLPAGSHQIDIYPAGSMVSALVSRPNITEAGKVYTIAAAGIEANIKLALLEDQPEVPPGETKVRFVHLSHDAPAVDIAVKNRDVVFPNIAFSQASKYIALTPMTVDLEARIAGTPNVVLTIPRMQFKADQAYTLLAVGSVVKEPELEAIIIAD